MPILIRLVTVNKICLFVLKSQNGNTHKKKNKEKKVNQKFRNYRNVIEN